MTCQRQEPSVFSCLFGFLSLGNDTTRTPPCLNPLQSYDYYDRLSIGKSLQNTHGVLFGQSSNSIKEELATSRCPAQQYRKSIYPNDDVRAYERRIQAQGCSLLVRMPVQCT